MHVGVCCVVCFVCRGVMCFCDPKVNHNDLQKASLKEAVVALEHVGTTVALLVEYRPDGKGVGQA